MELRSGRLSAAQPNLRPRRAAARPRARARPEREPSPPRQRQRVSEEEGCGLCQRTDQNPEIYGETCRQDGLCIHENCLYHASGLYQHGADEEGFFGFLLPDIQQHLQRVAQQTCCICRRRGASVRCHHRRCSRTFHYPCGTERRCVSQFFGEYRSFCWQHRPKQQVRPPQEEHPSCIICFEEVDTRPSYNTLVCPSCSKAMFHRSCIQGQALHAALHHFRCPNCQEMPNFQTEMSRLGIKIPDRDASWEMEEGAYHELYVQHSRCDANVCLCPQGREHSENVGPWRMLLCSSCSSCRTHQQCSAVAEDAESWECSGCSSVSTAPSVSGLAQ